MKPLDRVHNPELPLSVAELRKCLKLKDGGETYIFATTLSDERHVLMITEKA